jgi:hypothetical protein
LAPVQRQLLNFDGIEDEAAGGRGRLDELLLADDGDFLCHRADFHPDGQV